MPERENVYEKDVLRNGDLVLFDAILSPSMILGRHLRTGNLVDVTGIEFVSPFNATLKYEKSVFESIVFVCKFWNGKLIVLNGAELLDLILNYKEKHEDKIHKEILEKPHLRQFFL